MLSGSSIKRAWSGEVVSMPNATMTAITLPAGTVAGKCLVTAIVRATGNGIGAGGGTAWTVEANVLKIAQYSGSANTVDYSIVEVL